MASAVEICNLAMSFLGDSGNIATIAPPDATTAAKMCAIYYPIAKAAMLELHDWSFATKRGLLPQLATEEVYGWKGVYGLPADCMRVIGIQAHTAGLSKHDTWVAAHTYWATEPLDNNTFEVLSGRLYTNVRSPVATYVTSEVSEGAFSPTFVTAFAYYLATEIAGSRVKGEEGQKLSNLLSKQFQLALSVAKTRDANQQRKRIHYTPLWILGR